MGNEDFKLPPGWHCRSLVDCTKGGNISYGIVQPGQHQDDGIGIIRVNNIQNGKISVADVLKVSHDVESKFSKTRLEGGEVLLTLVGSTGLSAITTKDLHGWNVARAIAVIKPSDEISAEWIHICLQSTYTKYFLDSRANTTVQKTLNLKDVKEIPLPIPPIEERMNLEKIYFDLESKINLNLEINQTLEQMSQTLFKSWFVDFDPVIDNALDAGSPIPETLQSRAELRQKVRNSADFKPLPADIRALFPAEFEETELGWVPKGWDVVKTEDVAIKIGMGPFGSNIKVSTFVDSGVPVISGQHLKAILMVDGDNNFITSVHAEKLKNSAVYKKDIIFTHAGNIGQVSIIPDDSQYNEYIISQRQFYLRVNGSKSSPYYLIHYFRSEQGQHALLSNASQVGVPSIARPSTHLKNITILNPSKPLLEEFDKFCVPLFKQFNHNRKCSISLTILRDTLLPKLISGELSLEDLPDLVDQTEPA